MKEKYLISIDLGGTKVLTAVIDSNNKIIQRKKISTITNKGGAALVKSIAEGVSNLLKLSDLTEADIEAISIGVPGTVNIESGVIKTAPNLGIKNFNIREAFAKHFKKIPVLVENDVNLISLGIKKFELKDNVKNMLVVAVGTGIGSAFIFDGKLYRGSTYYAGEIGHIKIDCTNSESKTFENLASRTAVVNNIITEIKKGKKSYLKEYVEENKKVKSKVLQEAVKVGDTIAIKELENSCMLIGNVCANIVTLLNIDTIVFGGGVIEAIGPFMMPRIKKSFNKSVLKDSGSKVKLKVTKLGDDAAIYGGVALKEEFSKK